MEHVLASHRPPTTRSVKVVIAEKALGFIDDRKDTMLAQGKPIVANKDGNEMLYAIRICEVDCGGGDNKTMTEVHQLDAVVIKQM